MSLAYIGEINLGVLTPVALGCAASLTAALTADLALLLDLQIGLGLYPPSIGVSISAVITLIAQLNAAITIGLTLPTVNFMAEVIADLELTLAIPLAFSLLLGGGAGIFCYAFGGSGAAFGPAISSAISNSWPDGTSGAASANAAVLATTVPAVWDDVLGFCGVVPPGLPPGLTYVGQCNIGTLSPICVDATAAIIAELNARLAGMIAISITPPSIALSAILTAAIALKAALTAALDLELPGISFQLSAAAALVASVDAKIALLAKLTALLSGAGVMVFSYSGTGAALGPAFTSALGGGAWPNGKSAAIDANALVLGVTSPAVWVRVTTFFGGL